MPELRFTSSLSIDEIEENFKGIDYFNELKSGLQEALAYESGNPSPGTIVRERSLPTKTSDDNKWGIHNEKTA